jgi:hypothetical protein
MSYVVKLLVSTNNCTKTNNFNESCLHKSPKACAYGCLNAVMKFACWMDLISQFICLFLQRTLSNLVCLKTILYRKYVSSQIPDVIHAAMCYRLKPLQLDFDVVSIISTAVTSCESLNSCNISQRYMITTRANHGPKN